MSPHFFTFHCVNVICILYWTQYTRSVWLLDSSFYLAFNLYYIACAGKIIYLHLFQFYSVRVKLYEDIFRRQGTSRFCMDEVAAGHWSTVWQGAANRLKRKVYKSMFRPVAVHAMEYCPVKTKLRPQVMVIKMLRKSMGVMRLDDKLWSEWSYKEIDESGSNYREDAKKTR